MACYEILSTDIAYFSDPSGGKPVQRVGQEAIDTVRLTNCNGAMVIYYDECFDQLIKVPQGIKKVDMLVLYYKPNETQFTGLMIEFKTEVGADKAYPNSELLIGNFLKSGNQATINKYLDTAQSLAEAPAGTIPADVNQFLADGQQWDEIQFYPYIVPSLKVSKVLVRKPFDNNGYYRQFVSLLEGKQIKHKRTQQQVFVRTIDLHQVGETDNH